MERSDKSQTGIWNDKRDSSVEDSFGMTKWTVISMTEITLVISNEVRNLKPEFGMTKEIPQSQTPSE